MASGWRLAKSLETLRNQVNEAYPNRSKASDGTIGDAAHAATASDHNPNSQRVVCALDLTHDSNNGFDVHTLADRLRINRHPNLKYIISNSRICGAWTNWEWQRYTGINPHTSHAHFSVGVGPDGQSQPPYDDTTKWNIGGSMTKDQIIWNYRLIGGREPTSQEVDYWVDQVKKGRSYESVTEEHKHFFDKNGQGYNKYRKDSEKKIASMKKENDSLKKQVAELEKNPGGEFVKVSDLYIKK